MSTSALIRVPPLLSLLTTSFSSLLLLGLTAFLKGDYIKKCTSPDAAEFLQDIFSKEQVTRLHIYKTGVVLITDQKTTISAPKTRLCTLDQKYIKKSMK